MAKDGLALPKKNRKPAKVEMLRPTWWLEERNVVAGGKVNIEVPECGIEGMADVLAVEKCPRIDPGFGRTVLATFHHASAEIVDVSVEGLEGPIGSTPNHLFWSETREDFIPAQELLPGELVRATDKLLKVSGVKPRGPPEAVFNIEVQCDHVYRVGGTAGILVHNSGVDDCLDDFVDFAHGTIRSSADDIVKNGLNAGKAKALTPRGSGNPGDFHTFPVTEKTLYEVGVVDALGMASRQGDDLVLMIGRLPKSKVDKFVKEGKIIIEDIGGFVKEYRFKQEFFDEFKFDWIKVFDAVK